MKRVGIAFSSQYAFFLEHMENSSDRNSDNMEPVELRRLNMSELKKAAIDAKHAAKKKRLESPFYRVPPCFYSLGTNKAEVLFDRLSRHLHSMHVERCRLETMAVNGETAHISGADGAVLTQHGHKVTATPRARYAVVEITEEDGTTLLPMDTPNTNFDNSITTVGDMESNKSNPFDHVLPFDDSYLNHVRNSNSKDEQRIISRFDAAQSKGQTDHGKDDSKEDGRIYSIHAIDNCIKRNSISKKERELRFDEGIVMKIIPLEDGAMDTNEDRILEHRHSFVRVQTTQSAASITPSSSPLRLIRKGISSNTSFTHHLSSHRSSDMPHIPSLANAIRTESNSFNLSQRRNSLKLKETVNASHDSVSGALKQMSFHPTLTPHNSNHSNMVADISNSNSSSLKPLRSKYSEDCSADDDEERNERDTNDKPPILNAKKGHLNAAKNVFEELSTNDVYSNSALNETCSDLFFLSRPFLFFESVHALMMIISLYMALYWTNFLSTAAGSSWKILSLLPSIFSTVVFISLVRSAALIKAVYKVDFKAVLEVIEQTEASEQLKNLIRDTILKKLADMAGLKFELSLLHAGGYTNTDRSRMEGHLQAELYGLFDEIDTSKDGKLSRNEFIAFMNALDINMNRKKWMEVLKQIDRSNDGCICYENLFLFLFPKHVVAVALEKRRLKRLSARVKEKALRHSSAASKSSFSSNASKSFHSPGSSTKSSFMIPFPGRLTRKISPQVRQSFFRLSLERQQSETISQKQPNLNNLTQ
eukprot:CAMPEP_0170063050 /NCGR_PEP_ID=MMETSP0019_2-20121128/4064_1 /TAXON_ID=98059 /ORGANISM="Dinobryon sp., Strain UTEXLB2267" /LENGTH=761 /DNA_ID=CAMNT_0010269385 /DNA_START=762 /DNA_END=3047 /DNA_ORIENTATION=-